MPKWKEGDVVRVVTRPVTEDDRKTNRYFQHMAGLSGKVTNVYADNRFAIQVDMASVGSVVSEVHKASTLRMRDRFAQTASEEQKKALSKEELEFTPNYVLLVEEADLEKA